VEPGGTSVSTHGLGYLFTALRRQGLITDGERLLGCATPVFPGSRLADAQQLGRIPGRGGLAEAIRYTLSRWPALGHFLDDGRISLTVSPMTWSTPPQQGRPVAMTESFCTPYSSIWKH
jgi:hypothetical protein